MEAETFDIPEENIEPVSDRSFEGDQSKGATGGYFDGIESGAQEQVMAITPEEKREQMQDFARTIFEGVGEVLQALETNVELTTPEKNNLGQHWGNVLYHYWNLNGRKELDVANATVYTTSIGVKKSKEVRNKQSLNNGTE